MTLWIFQSLLAAFFAIGGMMKSTQPVEKLRATLSWAQRFPLKTISVIGILEMLAAVALIVPCALNIVPVLTPIAATCIALVQLLAILHHAKYSEVRPIVFNVLLFLSAAFVAVGRF